MALTVTVASRWSLQRDEMGQPLGMLETNRDITERKQAEEAVRKAQAELAHVARVTTLGEMAASIAHEVDQPLSGVVINANACLRFLTGCAAESRRSARRPAGHRPRRPAGERRDRADSRPRAPNGDREGAAGHQ